MEVSKSASESAGEQDLSSNDFSKQRSGKDDVDPKQTVDLPPSSQNNKLKLIFRFFKCSSKQPTKNFKMKSVKLVKDKEVCIIHNVWKKNLKCTNQVEQE